MSLPPGRRLPHSERAIELDPYNALFHALYGVVLLSDRRFDDATAAFQAALAIHPNYPFALGEMRNIYIAKGMRDELLADQQKRIAHDQERELTSRSASIHMRGAPQRRSELR